MACGTSRSCRRRSSNRCKMDTREKVKQYWLNPEPKNTPDKYIAGKRGDYLVMLMKKYVPKDAAILELGCNVGRNLERLRLAGYEHLQAIELNPKALELMKTAFPLLAGTFTCGTIEDILPGLEPVDVIYTMAVLEHIHPDSAFVFPEIVKHARTIIVIEDEVCDNLRICPRNYGEIFCDLGAHQLYEHVCTDIPELERCVARVFRLPLDAGPKK